MQIGTIHDQEKGQLSLVLTGENEGDFLRLYSLREDLDPTKIDLPGRFVEVPVDRLKHLVLPLDFLLKPQKTTGKKRK